MSSPSPSSPQSPKQPPAKPSPVAFDQSHAAAYDQRFAKLAPFKDSLHLLLGAIFTTLPADARILCVGAGTGAEIIYLAKLFPGWHFTAVDPSGPMLAVCRQRTTELGFADRVTIHEGYLDTLPPSPTAQPFHAATSILVSQFVLEAEKRTDFFRGIASRLVPEALLVSADLSANLHSPEYTSLSDVWFRIMATADITTEQIAAMRTAYGRDVAVLPPQQVTDLIKHAGFTTPILFLQTALIHAWYARKIA